VLLRELGDHGAFQTEREAGAPWLTIASEGGTNVVISWIPDDPGWVLQETSSLQSNWVVSASGSTNPVAIPTTEAAMFYRLEQP
jgi:hypothetical protein